MQSRDFCFWLQGFFELTDHALTVPKTLNADQVAMIRQHLTLVFEHEFGRPAMGEIFALTSNMNGDESHRIC